MKRSLENAPSRGTGNESRQKVKDALLPFDQSPAAGAHVLAAAAATVLGGRPDGSLAARGLMHEVNGAVPEGALTKRGEPRSAAAYVKQIFGGCRAWCESLAASGAFEVVGDWDAATAALRLAGAPGGDAGGAGDAGEPLAAGQDRSGVVAFWDLKRGWGKVAVDGAPPGRRVVFVHNRDVAGRSSLPRGGRVDFRVRSAPKGFEGAAVALRKTTDADVDALLGRGCLAAMALDAPASLDHDMEPAAPPPAAAAAPVFAVAIAPATLSAPPPPPPEAVVRPVTP